MDKINYTCVGINALNECRYATLSDGHFGCRFEEYCKYKRPDTSGDRIDSLQQLDGKIVKSVYSPFDDSMEYYNSIAED